MGKVTDQQHVLQFLHKHPMATISTVDMGGNKLESALIAFAELNSLEIIFETFYNTRKYNNLRRNDKVALVIGWDMRNYVTLQYEGIARQLTKEEIPKYRAVFLKKKTPCTEQFLFDPRVRLFCVRPTWILLSDYTGRSPKFIEIKP